MNVSFGNSVHFAPKTFVFKKQNENTQTATNVYSPYSKNKLAYNTASVLPMISFKADNKNLPAVYTPPKENEFSQAENNFAYARFCATKDDIVLVGQDKDSATKALIKNIDNLNQIVNKVYFVEDKTVKTPFAAYFDDNTVDVMINLGEEPINMVTNKDSSEKKYPIHPGETGYMYDVEKLELGSSTFGVGIANPYKDKESSSDFYATTKVFDFKGVDQKSISRINVKHLEEVINNGLKDHDAKGNKKIGFADVGGQETAIQELKKSVVYPIQFPSAYKNRKVNKGIILTGGPGTGKTLMAKALANEVDAHFMKINGLEMESKYVGESEANWRNLIEEAKANQPTILFIDEFDAVAKKREGTEQSRNDDKVVNQILTLMTDITDDRDQVYVIAATNRLELLDPAITRSERFGKHISVENPNLEGCKKILDIHFDNKIIDPELNRDYFANELFAIKASGADISKIADSAEDYSYERVGVTEKMANGTFSDEDLVGLNITAEDMENAIEEFKTQQDLTAPKKEKDSKKEEESTNYKETKMGFLADLKVKQYADKPEEVA